MFPCSKTAQITFLNKPQLKIISFLNYKHRYLIHTWSDKALKDTIENRALALLQWRFAWRFAHSSFNRFILIFLLYHSYAFNAQKKLNYPVGPDIETFSPHYSLILTENYIDEHIKFLGFFYCYFFVYLRIIKDVIRTM